MNLTGPPYIIVHMGSGLRFVLGAAMGMAALCFGIFILATLTAPASASIFSMIGLSKPTFVAIVGGAFFAPLLIGVIRHFGARANSSL